MATTRPPKIQLKRFLQLVEQEVDQRLESGTDALTAQDMARRASARFSPEVIEKMAHEVASTIAMRVSAAYVPYLTRKLEIGLGEEFEDQSELPAFVRVTGVWHEGEDEAWRAAKRLHSVGISNLGAKAYSEEHPAYVFQSPGSLRVYTQEGTPFHNHEGARVEILEVPESIEDLDRSFERSAVLLVAYEMLLLLGDFNAGVRAKRAAFSALTPYLLPLHDMRQTNPTQAQA